MATGEHPWDSVERQRPLPTQSQRVLEREIISQIGVALEKLGAQSDLLAVVGSWKSTMSDEDTLSDLKAWNEGGQSGG